MAWTRARRAAAPQIGPTPEAGLGLRGPARVARPSPGRPAASQAPGDFSAASDQKARSSRQARWRTTLAGSATARPPPRPGRRPAAAGGRPDSRRARFSTPVRRAAGRRRRAGRGSARRAAWRRSCPRRRPARGRGEQEERRCERFRAGAAARERGSHEHPVPAATSAPRTARGTETGPGRRRRGAARARRLTAYHPSAAKSCAADRSTRSPRRVPTGRRPGGARARRSGGAATLRRARRPSEPGAAGGACRARERREQRQQRDQRQPDLLRQHRAQRERRGRRQPGRAPRLETARQATSEARANAAHSRSERPASQATDSTWTGSSANSIPAATGTASGPQSGAEAAQQRGPERHDQRARHAVQQHGRGVEDEPAPRVTGLRWVERPRHEVVEQVGDDDQRPVVVRAPLRDVAGREERVRRALEVRQLSLEHDRVVPDEVVSERRQVDRDGERPDQGGREPGRPRGRPAHRFTGRVRGRRRRRSPAAPWPASARRPPLAAVRPFARAVVADDDEVEPRAGGERSRIEGGAPIGTEQAARRAPRCRPGERSGAARPVDRVIGRTGGGGVGDLDRRRRPAAAPRGQRRRRRAGLARTGPAAAGGGRGLVRVRAFGERTEVAGHVACDVK